MTGIGLARLALVHIGSVGYGTGLERVRYGSASQATAVLSLAWSSMVGSRIASVRLGRRGYSIVWFG